MISVVGPEVTEKYKSRLQPSNIRIRTVTGKKSSTTGMLNTQLEVEGVSRSLCLHAAPKLDQEVILGMDFAKQFDIVVHHRRDLWKVDGGPWREFAKEERDENTPLIFAECAGITVVTNEERLAFEALADSILPKYSSDDIHGYTTLITHIINVQNADPIRQAPRRYSPAIIAIMQQMVRDMFKAGIIEPSSSAWRFSPVLPTKSDTPERRFCVDYRPLNQVTKPDAFPMPSMDSILDKLRGAKYISKIDLKSAFHQILLDPDSRQYTAFAVPGSGLWQFTRMPFGLSNSPLTFARLVNALFGPEFEPNLFVYLDDLILITETKEEHEKWLRIVLNRIVEAGLVVNRKKCKFLVTSVVFLGYRLDENGLRPDPDKVKPVLNYPKPDCVKSLRRFLGMVQWYSRFIDKESDIKIPLVRLLRKDQEWEWGDEQQRAFETLKIALTQAPVLARPDFTKPFTIQSDASSYAIAVCLTQVFDDGEHPIAYASRVLSAAERNYTTTEREALAMLFGIRKFRPYIEGYKFKVITDHNSLKYLKNFKDATGRIARWILEMQQYDFEIEYKKGAENYVPDALSRSLDAQVYDVCAFEVIADEWYSRRVDEINKSPGKYRDWCIIDDKLYKFVRNGLIDPIVHPDECWKLVVPANHRERVLSDAHNEASTNHFGVQKTYDRVAREYTWPSLWHDVHTYVRSCEKCQKYKVPQTAPLGLMGKRVVERPWIVVSTDVMELPRSKSQYKYVVVFQDLFTRWIELKPLRRATGKAIAKAFEELVLFRWDCPLFLISDNGTEYQNKFLKATLEDYGVKHLFIPPYHPQANPTERSNRTIKTLLATLVEDNHRSWDEHLHEVRHAINTAVQSSTKVSPAFLNLGRNPNQVKSLRREVEDRVEVTRIDPQDWLDRLKRLDYLRDLVAKHIDEAQTSQAKYYNRGRKHGNFSVGDLVLVRTHVLSNKDQAISKKLSEKFEGPFEIKAALSNEIFELDMGSRRRKAQAHVSDLKKFTPPRACKYRQENTTN